MAPLSVCLSAISVSGGGGRAVSGGGGESNEPFKEGQWLPRSAPEEC